MQQQHTVCDFSGSDSWVILSPIEQSIKHKIESVGTPLKDWDIQINYGIKTGYNDAFIISTAKRNEILSHTADYVAGQAEKDYSSTGEYARTAALIRPILRGRDIKRYGYNWAELWLINTHNGVKENGKVKIPRIDINDYPAVKAHLDTYWDKIKNRADQGDTPYNLRNCAYIDDFNQPKICWKAVGRNLAFAIVEAGIYLTAPACFISAGIHNEYILAFLCSNIGKYFIYKNSDTTGAGDIMLNIQSLIRFPIPLPSAYLGQIHSAIDKQDDAAINEIVYAIYNFTEDEQKQIESI